MNDKASRQSLAARRFGYGVAVAVNAVLLLAINWWPGWQAVPFLTPDTELVIGFVNASVIASLLVNVVYLVRDDRPVRSAGDLVTVIVGLVALLRVWQVFPFDFGAATFDWALVFHILLGVAIVGSAIGILVSAIRLAGSVGHRHHPRGAAL